MGNQAPALLVTGGAGFIGSAFVRTTLARDAGFSGRIVTLDKLTYAGSRDNLADVAEDPRHVFVHGDIGDGALVARLLREHQVTAVVNLAAETHVDRSIAGPRPFVDTNVGGTLELLDATRAYLATLPADTAAAFRFVHVSTDEVFGSIEGEGAFTEASPYAPSSPYAASKAAADHLVRAYHRTYGFPSLITHCTNNYGPYQFPEKLLPLTLGNALAGKALPIYGDGLHVRDWLFVDDHCQGLRLALQRGTPGQSYAFGARNTRTNLDLVHAACDLLDELAPRPGGGSYRQQVTHVADRPGHDRRYAVDPAKAEAELAFRPNHEPAVALRRTVAWYLANGPWCARVTAKSPKNP